MNNYQLDNSDLLKITKRLQRDFGVTRIKLENDYERNLVVVLGQAVSAARIGFSEYIIFRNNAASPKRFLARVKNLSSILDELINEVTMYTTIHGSFPRWYFNPVEFLAWVVIYRDMEKVISSNSLPDSILSGIIKMISSLVYLKNAKEEINKNGHLSLAMINEVLSYLDNTIIYSDDNKNKVNSLKERVSELLAL